MSVHIVPIGLDSPERFTEGFKKYPPTKVIFLMGTEQSNIENEALKIKDEVQKNLGVHVASIEHKAQLFNFSDAMKSLAEIITKERKENKNQLIYINISSSTKVITQAAYMAASLFFARIYYVPAVNYLSTELLPILNNEDEINKEEMLCTFMKDKKYLSMGVKEAFEIPVLKMKPPNEDEINVLRKINETKQKKYSSLKSLLEEGLNLDYSSGSIRNKYSQTIKKLERSGFVSTNRSGREKGIKLTGSGEVIAEISSILKPVSDIYP